MVGWKEANKVNGIWRECRYCLDKVLFHQILLTSEGSHSVPTPQKCPYLGQLTSDINTKYRTQGACEVPQSENTL